MNAQTKPQARPLGNYRYPTEVLWGADYADGFRHITANDDASALAMAHRNGAKVRLQNMQKLGADGQFHYIYDPAKELP